MKSQRLQTGSETPIRHAGLKVVCALALLTLLAFALTAQADFRFTILTTLDIGTDGTGIMGLTPGSDGNFYGTTFGGGKYDSGTIFRMTPAGAITTLVNADNTNFFTPYGSLMQAADGDFYGVEDYKVFRMTTNGETTVVAAFNQTNVPEGGYEPNPPLAQGRDGSFYGTTPIGPGNTGGTVFKLTPVGELATLTTIMGGTHGERPIAGLTLGNDGDFYGTTSGVSSGVDATVFKITPEGALTTLAYFARADDDQDTPSLTLGSDGNFYGTTTYGPKIDNGTAFKITPAGELTILARFTNGAYPVTASTSGLIATGLVEGPDGNFYGTLSGVTFSTLTNAVSTLFQMTPSGAITNVAILPGQPIAGPILGSDGNLYGATLGDHIYRLVLPPVFQSLAKSGTNAILTWSAAIGQSYQPQYTSDLLSTNWISLGAPVTATNLTLTISDSPGTNTQRFYRVQLLP